MIYANLDGNEFRIYSIKKKKIYIDIFNKKKTIRLDCDCNYISEKIIYKMCYVLVEIILSPLRIDQIN